MTRDRSLPRETIERMVRAVDPAWTLARAVPDEHGHATVSHLEIDTGDGRRRCVLKATVDDVPRGIATESRLLGLVADRTSIPVPTVIAAVDDREALPTPYFLMEAMPETALPFSATSRLADPVLRRIALQTGAYLGELHGVEVVDAYGVFAYEAAEPADGIRPTVDPERFGVANPVDDWPAYLATSVNTELVALESSRFADLVDPLRSAIDERCRALPSEWPPVVARIDHGVHNALVRPATGDIEAVIDWGFTLAATPGYDLETVAYVLSGAVLAPLAGATDRRDLVREALAAGYDETARYPAAELAAAGSLYELVAVVRAMHHLHIGVAKIPDGVDEPVAAGLRADIDRLLG